VTISSSPSGASGDVTLDSYDAAAHVYLEQSVPPRPAVTAYLDAVAGLVGSGTVLELGSGPGWDADYLESRGPRVLRTDGAPAFVQMVKATGHHARLLDVRVDDFGGPYDAVLADAVLLHVTREQFVDVLQRARQAVASGGVLAMTLKEGDGEAWTEAKLGTSPTGVAPQSAPHCWIPAGRSSRSSMSPGASSPGSSSLPGPVRCLASCLGVPSDDRPPAHS